MRVIPSFIRPKPKFNTNHCFQQSWAKLRVNLEGCIHNLSCDLVGFHEPDFLAQSRGGRRERQMKI